MRAASLMMNERLRPGDQPKSFKDTMRNRYFLSEIRCGAARLLLGASRCVAPVLALAVVVQIAIAQQPVTASASPADAAACSADASGTAQAALPGLAGTVDDTSGAALSLATLLLTAPDGRTERASTDAEGQFRFDTSMVGHYVLTASAPGFAPRTVAVDRQQNDCITRWAFVLTIASQEADAEVSASSRDVAEAQMALAEQQRVLGLVPNFYASYVWDADPLRASQKFRLAWRFATDPFIVVTAGLMAGTEQAQGTFRGYGQGSLGYLKRFGAGYADIFDSTLIGQALLPALLHQDPRYFVKGTGSVPKRAFYAVTNTLICRKDNGRWQPNYSNVLGNVASAELSNVYYPASSRHGLGLTVSNSLTTTGLGLIGNLFQEFVLRSITPHVPDYEALRR